MNAPSRRATTRIRVQQPGNRKTQGIMRATRIPAQRPNRFTHLSASITEEDGCFTVEMSLSNHAKPDKGFAGEEIVESIEMASALLHAVAKMYSIPQARIKIHVHMENAREGTHH
jgi:hypothetical protein